jgi:uncharacterized RDD family membrane protein YckC
MQPEAVRDQQMTFPRSQGDPRIKRVFASFGVRMAAIALDFFVVLFLGQALLDNILIPAELWAGDHRPVLFSVMAFYFVVFWICPLQSTPGQFLFGMRIVNHVGEKLTLQQAALRSVALAVLIALALGSISSANPYFIIPGLAGYALLFLAATTRNRQGGHDLLARSMVINRIALRSAEDKRLLLQHVANTDPATKAHGRPSVMSTIGNFLILAAPIFLLINVALIMKDRDLSYRTNYAIAQTSDLQNAVRDYHARHMRLPNPNDNLGVHSWAPYPAGGHYRLYEQGVIRIRFEQKPELTNGTIVIRPILDDGHINWQCSVEGDIARKYLPRSCQDAMSH